jgi:hypothetical protein
LEKLKEKTTLGLRKMFLKEQDVKVWNGLDWFRILGIEREEEMEE